MSSFFNTIIRSQLQFTINCADYTIINGDLDLRGTSVTYLPERLVVGGSLLMSGNRSGTSPCERNFLPAF